MKQALGQGRKGEHDIELSGKDRYYPNKCCKLSGALTGDWNSSYKSRSPLCLRGSE